MSRLPSPGEVPGSPTSVAPRAGRPSSETDARGHQRSCVIGAGLSGLAACKALLDRGVPFSCFEAGDQVGGLWVLGNRNGLGAAYRSLQINTSRDRSAFSDFSMPDDYPDYPPHALIARYLQNYAEHFGLTEKIRFSVAVNRVLRRRDGRFDVTLSNGEQTTFDTVIVANGHHWDPHLPSLPWVEDFSGIRFHSHAYLDPVSPFDLRNRRVVVVGFGNSAVDIACDLAHASDPEGPPKVFLSVRRGAWVLPKYVFGRPLDQARGLPGLVPRRLRQSVAELWYRAVIGDLTRWGLPRPDHRLGDAHPTVSDQLPSLLECGRIVGKPVIEHAQGRSLIFADGTRETVDAIVLATGYKISFPFFDSELISAPNNELPLYLRIFHPEQPGLFFIGLCQPLGAIVPIAEAQSRLVAATLSGDYRLPERAEMHAAIDADRERIRARFGSSLRHTMQLDLDDYLKLLNRETRAGARRAKLSSR